jgi:hypothetical protein
LIKAELAFMTDAGKAALYLRSILEELHMEQLNPQKLMSTIVEHNS